MELQRAKGSFIQHVGTLMTGTGFAQAVTTAGTLILARLFAPEEFGLLALYTTLVSFLSVIGGGRYELAIMLPDSDEEAANVLNLSLSVAFGISLLCLMIVALMRAPIATLLGNARMASWLWSVPAVLLLNNIYQSLSFWCGRMKQFRLVALARMCMALGTIGGQLTLYLLHVEGGKALIGGWIFGQFVAAFILGIQVLVHQGKFLLTSFNGRSVKASLIEYRNFPFYKAPYSFIINAATQLVIVILKVFSNLQVVGLYSLATRAVYLPVSLISNSLNEVFYQKAATELRFGGLENFANRVLRVQVLLATPVLVFVVFEAKFLFGHVLGARWAGGGAFVAFLAFVGYSYFLTSWLDRLFDVRGRQKLSLALAFAGNSSSLAALTATLVLTRKPVLAVGAFTVSQVAWEVIWLSAAYRVAGFRVASLLKVGRYALFSGLIPAALTALTAIGFQSHPWAALGSAAMILAFSLLFVFIRYVRSGYALSSTADRFRRFWADKSTCLNHEETPEFYRAMGEELRQLFSRQYQSVLEIGCGEGSLFKYLPFNATTYRGVDFTRQFVEAFRSKYPGVQVECADGASYCSENERYDLIFSNGVIQHFDEEMLARHLANARKMMKSDSELIVGCVPDKTNELAYQKGAFGQNNGAGLRRLFKAKIQRLLGKDPMGFWYDKKEIAQLAKEQGFSAQFTPSQLYPYRFHVTLRFANSNGSSQRQPAA